MTVRSLLSVTSAVCLACCLGCHSAPKQNPEIDTLLQSVAYESSTPPAQLASQSRVEPRPVDRTPDAADQTLADVQRLASGARNIIGSSLRSVASGISFPKFSIAGLIDAMLGIDDDDDSYPATPQGRADRNFDQWMKDRERWREGKR